MPTIRLPIEHRQRGETLAQHRVRTAPWRTTKAAAKEVDDARTRLRAATNELAGLVDQCRAPASQRARVAAWHAALVNAYSVLRELDTGGWQAELRQEIAPRDD